MTTFSFEFYPPKNEEAQRGFEKAVQDLAKANPAFMTVTYGAGGSTRHKTVELAAWVRRETQLPTASHLTCLSTPKVEIAAYADQLWNADVRHIVALRGDAPKDGTPVPERGNAEYYHYANELVPGLLAQHPFEISVAAYPEKHPQAPDLDTDIQNLKRKCEAGATRAITQFFFDNDTFLRFRDKAQAAGIQTPIVPGLLPIANFKNMTRFAKMCEANVPAWLSDVFNGLENNPEHMVEKGTEILVRQTQDLLKEDVPHIHFYTLNRADQCLEAVKVIQAASHKLG